MIAGYRLCPWLPPGLITAPGRGCISGVLASGTTDPVPNRRWHIGAGIIERGGWERSNSVSKFLTPHPAFHLLMVLWVWPPFFATNVLFSRGWWRNVEGHEAGREGGVVRFPKICVRTLKEGLEEEEAEGEGLTLRWSAIVRSHSLVGCQERWERPFRRQNQSGLAREEMWWCVRGVWDNSVFPWEMGMVAPLGKLRNEGGCMGRSVGRVS